VARPGGRGADRRLPVEPKPRRAVSFLSPSGWGLDAALRLEPVSNPRFVDDVSRVGRVVAQLLAYLRDDVARVVFVADRVVAPDLTQQSRVRYRLSRMEGEVAQQLVLSWRQVHGPSFDHDRPARQVYLEVA